MKRILITGGPGCGKTSLSIQIAMLLGLDQQAIQHTDDLVGVLEWSAASAEVATWLDGPAPSVIEGVCLPRALRKWLVAHPTGAPADILIYLTQPYADQTKGQIAMGKGVDTVLRGIEAELVARGVEIRRGREREHVGT
jgi:hypothetical protein